MTLMNFEDSSERVLVRGPLFAAAAKLSVPVFGPEKFQYLTSQPLLNAAIKKALRSPEDLVVDLLLRADSELSQSHLLSDAAISTSQSSSSNKVFTSREVHENLHYSMLSLGSSRKLNSELLDHVMLRRALDGYLFDCGVNRIVATDDHWLQDLWEWIQGTSNRGFMALEWQAE